MYRRVSLGLIVLLGACSDDSTAPTDSVPSPVIDFAGVAANPNNVLSAVVTVRVRHADSVAVRFRRSEFDLEAESQTAAVALSGDSVRVPVLGLYANSHHTLRAVAFGPGGTIFGPALELVTDTLPSDLPRYSASGSDPSQGYVVFAANPFGIVIDNTGRVVWYHRFQNGLGLNFMAQPNGRFVARPPTPTPDDIEPWVEIDVLGNVTRTLACARGLQPRLHDLIALADGSYWILCDELRTLDWSSIGLSSNARVTGTVVQHIADNGAVLFDWSVFEHFQPNVIDTWDRNGSNINWTHGNAIDLDFDGDPVVSFRNLGEITKLSRANGSVKWRLGGQNNQFMFIGTQTPAFSRQHGLRFYGSNHLILLDNLGDQSNSRVERYVLDTNAMTATLAESHSSVPSVVTQIGGSVQDLGNRALVSFGTAGRVEEYDDANRLVWQINGNAGYVFRAQRIRSLYAPGVGSPR